VDDMTEDRLHGTADEIKGTIKEGAGKLAGDRSTELSGKLDRAKGKVEGKVGETKDAIRREGGRSR
jgi:uncharacterized protein YjbJ (UPF0337 family)